MTPLHPAATLIDRAVGEGGLNSGDLCASISPLLHEVSALHEVGLVAPLRGIAKLWCDDQMRLTLNGASGTPPSRNRSLLRQIQKPESAAFDLVGEQRVTRQVDIGIATTESIDVVEPGESVKRPMFVSGFETWEQQIGQHDEASDIASLGLLLASLALGLDFRRRGDLETFVANRHNLFRLNERLHPVIARLITEMAEPNRERRAQDVASLAARLDTYREQPIDFDLDSVPGAAHGPLRSRRRAIQQALRDRLFEINRRNRLVWFVPTAQTLNMTIGSVPLLLDVRNIQPEQIATWKAPLSNDLVAGRSLVLNSVLRFEDSPYLPATLDKLISQARRDRAEYGAAQLRLVVCFLRWHNLRAVREERINSPLLLLPVEVTKKRGVRDTYLLNAPSPIAEVNPALRHILFQTYGITLPETFDLSQQDVNDLHLQLEAQIQLTEPGVVLSKLDKPQIEIVQQRARLRVDQFRKRSRVVEKSKQDSSISYSYSPSDLRPRGIQMFDGKVRYRPPEALRFSAGAPATPRSPNAAPIDSSVDPSSLDNGPANSGLVVTERVGYSLKDPSTGNPYRWELDLCALTIANFNYRKMTLVRDYTQLIDSDEPSDSFDRIFSLDARPLDTEPLPAFGLADQHLIVPADGTQRDAIARARSGRSFIIQGPPGTGKSQTITNLVADFAARGKRVLFVCEKRAAIDVVYARLRKQGLDELCALIHDSQADKRTFIQELKATYEQWLEGAESFGTAERERQGLVDQMQSDLDALHRVDGAMATKPSGSDIDLRAILERIITLRSAARSEENPDQPALGSHIDNLPTVAQWHREEAGVRRLTSTLRRLGEPPMLASHPIADIQPQIAQSARPAEELARRATEVVNRSQSLLVQRAKSHLQTDPLTIGELQSLCDLAAYVQQVGTTSSDALAALLPRSTAALAIPLELASERSVRDRFVLSTAKTAAWRDPLSATDAATALQIATEKEGSPFKFLSGAWRSLKKTVEARYDFSAHAVAPSISSVLSDLVENYNAADALRATEESARARFGVESFSTLNDGLAALHRLPEGPASALRDRIGANDAAGATEAEALSQLHSSLHELLLALQSLFVANARPISELVQRAGRLRDNASSWAELLSDLRVLDGAPEVAQLLRSVAMSPVGLELVVLERAVADFEAQNIDFTRFSATELMERLERVGYRAKELCNQNAVVIRERLRDRFRKNVALSNLSASQLSAEQKSLKKLYGTGRRELEHEFSKTMRYRSIRDLASGPTGSVIMDMRPIWLMSPLSVSDTLPLSPDQFDVVIFDEASQIPLEEAVPALYRTHQTIVVGDRMQLPPTSFFRSMSADESADVDDEGQGINLVLDGDSFLSQASATLPSTMLAWHYRSQSEELIGFSNAAFYGGALSTVPDRHGVPGALVPIEIRDSYSAGDAGASELLARNVSFHFVNDGVYENRRNLKEAVYIAQLVRSLLQRESSLTVGVAAFSEAQQGAIEEELERLAADDPVFAQRLEAEEIREDDNQFVGLFVKNLENIQGDEREVILMSVCYAPGPNGRMLMNFGPINQQGGEKRLNVIFSRARKHMAIVTSIRSTQITNEHNDGANTLRRFLAYAEALSSGDDARAVRVLETVNPQRSRNLERLGLQSPVVTGLAEVLRQRGWLVDVDHGRSSFRCDLAVRAVGDHDYRVAVLVDTQERTASANAEERTLTHTAVLEAFGWRVVHVLTKDWFHDPAPVVEGVEFACLPA